MAAATDGLRPGPSVEDPVGMARVEVAAMTMHLSSDGRDPAGGPVPWQARFKRCAIGCCKRCIPTVSGKAGFLLRRWRRQRAAGALALSGGTIHAPRVDAGIAWLCEHHNADGGWGDTTDIPAIWPLPCWPSPRSSLPGRREGLTLSGLLLWKRQIGTWPSQPARLRGDRGSHPQRILS